MSADHVLANPISPDHLISSFGVVGIGLILFAECGLLIGFFLPGDTLLLAAGIGIATGLFHLSLTGALIVAPVGAFLGNLLGYAIGYRVGPRVFDRPDSRLFSPGFVSRSEAFFDRFGSWTVLLGRFVPIVRTVATVMAGVAKMSFLRYAIYSLVGAVIWADGVLLLGHQLGKIKFVQHNKGYLDYIIVLAVIVSLAPTAIHYVRARRTPRSPRPVPAEQFDDR
ncbi:MAG: DedA family protein [Actinobacteria bacterium]|nr:DedA family protein [Actinomycetota bacterium]